MGKGMTHDYAQHLYTCIHSICSLAFHNWHCLKNRSDQCFTLPFPMKHIKTHTQLRQCVVNQQLYAFSERSSDDDLVFFFLFGFVLPQVTQH